MALFEGSWSELTEWFQLTNRAALSGLAVKRSSGQAVKQIVRAVADAQPHLPTTNRNFQPPTTNHQTPATSIQLNRGRSTINYLVRFLHSDVDIL